TCSPTTRASPGSATAPGARASASAGTPPRCACSTSTRRHARSAPRAEPAPGPIGRASGARLGALQDEDRDLARRALLVVGVRRVRRDGTLPPQRRLLAVHLARDVVVALRPVLQLDARVREHVVVPDGVLRRAPERRDDRVRAVV